MERAAPLSRAVPESAFADWPRTTRVLPWLAAALTAMLFVVPIDSMVLPVPLPFDARPDRLLLGLAFVVWALVVAVAVPRRTEEGGGHRFGAVELALVTFALLAIASVALNLSVLQGLGEASLASKKLVLLASYLAFYVFVVSVLRPSEVPAYIRMIVALATVAALCAIVEYAFGVNVLFRAAGVWAPPGTEILSDGTVLTPQGRPDVTGPTRHGLAISALLSMVLPLALGGSAFARSRSDRWLYTVAALVIFAGAVCTLRRTGVILPFVACSAVLVLGGRRMLPALALFLVTLALLPLVAPGAVDDVIDQFSATNQTAQQSVAGRTSDYEATEPDVRAGALLGRGFGTYDAQVYRLLDNEYITLTIETGFLGLAAYLAAILAAIGMALRARSRLDPEQGWIALAGVGSALAFLFANAFFDALAFPHAPYGFLLIVALVAISRRAPALVAGKV